MATLKQLLEYAEQTFAGTTAVKSLRKIIIGLQANIDAGGGGGGQAQIQFKDEGSNLGTTGTVTSLDFVGANVTAARAGNAVTVTVAGGSQKAAIQAGFYEPQGQALVAGASVEIPLRHAITLSTADSWQVNGDQTGSVVLDVELATAAGYPTFTNIAASAKPTLSSARRATGAMTGWTTSAAAGDTIRISINTVSTLEKVAVSIPCTVT